jgi:PAS domain S-box-containing protein
MTLARQHAVAVAGDVQSIGVWCMRGKQVQRADALGAAAAAAAVRPGGPRYDVEYRVLRPDGALRVVHSQGDVTWDGSGRPLRKFGVLQDITELKQVERELRASEERFCIFVDRATDGFFLLDDDWTILDVNRQACLGLGYSREELIGKHKSDFDVGLDGTSVQRLKQRTIAGEAITFETHHRRKDGTSKPMTPSDILVVAPYNAHVALLGEKLAPKGVRVGTVDRFQGQQAPVVIYSMATSTPEDAPRGMEFLYSLNRLNVGTSRAQCACILVASPRLFEPECKSPRQMQLANALCRYLELARMVEAEW